MVGRYPFLLSHRILFKTKIYERKYKKSASSSHTQTGYISALDCSGKSFHLKASWDTHVFQAVWKKLPQGANKGLYTYIYTDDLHL